MKQHITVQQLKELNQKQLSILNKLIFGKSYQRPLRVLAIGKMIEILKQKYDTVSCLYTTKQWVVYIEQWEDGELIFKNDWIEIGLCDALWQAIKHVLSEVE